MSVLTRKRKMQKPDIFKITVTLGKGAFGEVFKGICQVFINLIYLISAFSQHEFWPEETKKVRKDQQVNFRNN